MNYDDPGTVYFTHRRDVPTPQQVVAAGVLDEEDGDDCLIDAEGVAVAILAVSRWSPNRAATWEVCSKPRAVSHTPLSLRREVAHAGHEASKPTGRALRPTPHLPPAPATYSAQHVVPGTAHTPSENQRGGYAADKAADQGSRSDRSRSRTTAVFALRSARSHDLMAGGQGKPCALSGMRSPPRRHSAPDRGQRRSLLDLEGRRDDRRSPELPL